MTLKRSNEKRNYRERFVTGAPGCAFLSFVGVHFPSDPPLIRARRRSKIRVFMMFL